MTNANVTCSEAGLPTGCRSYYDIASDTDYLFYYPNDDTTQYLYETYPNLISPLEGVMNEHFIVWMRTAMLPTFRKLYGVINSSFSKGDKIVINITANYEVDSFDGSKGLLLGTVGSYGGKNIFPGQLYLTVGSVCLGAGIVLLGKELKQLYF